MDTSEHLAEIIGYFPEVVLSRLLVELLSHPDKVINVGDHANRSSLLREEALPRAAGDEGVDKCLQLSVSGFNRKIAFLAQEM